MIEYAAGCKTLVESRIWTVNVDNSSQTDEIFRRKSVAFALDKEDKDMDEMGSGVKFPPPGSMSLAPAGWSQLGRRATGGGGVGSKRGTGESREAPLIPVLNGGSGEQQETGELFPIEAGARRHMRGQRLVERPTKRGTNTNHIPSDVLRYSQGRRGVGHEQREGLRDAGDGDDEADLHLRPPREGEDRLVDPRGPARLRWTMWRRGVELCTLRTRGGKINTRCGYTQK